MAFFGPYRAVHGSRMRAETMDLFVACAGHYHPEDLHNYKMALKAIKRGAVVNFRCNSGQLVLDNVCVFSSFDCYYGETLTPLFVACFHGELEVVRLLLGHGANDERALYVAVESRHPSFDERRKEKLEIAKLLIGRGFDVRFKNPKGRTVLCSAVHSGCVDTVKLLIEKGALVTDCICPPLAKVFDFQSFEYDPEREVVMAKLLLENGADPNVCVNDGKSLINGDHAVAKAIREHLKQVESATKQGDDQVEGAIGGESDGGGKSNKKVGKKEEKKKYENSKSDGIGESKKSDDKEEDPESILEKDFKNVKLDDNDVDEKGDSVNALKKNNTDEKGGTNDLSADEEGTESYKNEDDEEDRENTLKERDGKSGKLSESINDKEKRGKKGGSDDE